jgi:alpha-maltose-1-phosphate synthase
VEQLGNAYHLSTWIENNGITQADAVIAVSQETRNDVLKHFEVNPDKVKVIHNGIDLNQYRHNPQVDALVKHGVDPERPYVLFVGRITRQKGIIHLVNAIPYIDPSIQVVLCAGAPDTPDIAREMATRVAEVSADRPGVIWIQEMLPKDQVIQYYSNATVFCCPSVYEPFGIINLEAMACETAVVASAVGGIPEVVVPKETGELIPLELKPGTFDPVDPAAFSRALAEGINAVALDPAVRARYERNGRKRVEEHFSWTAVANRTLDLYKSL